MSAENHLQFLCNVGSADAIRVIENDEGKPSIVSFSIAVTEYRYNKETKAKENLTDWHKATAFGFVAQRIARFVEQGQKFLLVGRLAKDEYEKDGEKRYDYFIQVEDFAPISSGGGGSRSSEEVSSPVLDDDEFPF